MSINAPLQPGQLSQVDPQEDQELDKSEGKDPEQVWYDEYRQKPFKDLAERMVELKRQASKAEGEMKALKAELDVIRIRVVPDKFAEEGMTSIRIAGVGRLGLTSDAYCNVDPTEDREGFYELLRSMGHGDIIKETVNPSTLKSMVKEMHVEHIAQASEFDPSAEEPVDSDDLSEFERISKYVKYTPFMRASVTKG